MTYVQRLMDIGSSNVVDAAPLPQRQPLVLVVEDGDLTAATLQPICDFLEIGLEQVPSEQDLARTLRDYCPMGVVAHMDCQGQDGCHVMMTIAQHDRSLPILLIIGDDAALAGAADAVEELWQLESVLKAPSLPGVGTIVDFLFRVGRRGRCMRLMPG